MLTSDIKNDLEKAKSMSRILLEIADDKRIPASVREEYMDKVNTILERK